MSACESCLYRAILRNEVIGFAENRVTDAVSARELLALDDAEAIEVLKTKWPEVERRLERRVASFCEGEVPDVWSLCRHGGWFPEPMLQLSDPPAALFGVGSRDRFDEIASGVTVAIVGSRRASSAGKQVAMRLASDLVSAGIGVVSGMALGIDAAAHRGALQTGGRTIAVLAGGPEYPYPRSHAALYREITIQGVVVSERPPGSRAQRWGFPARNRIIAALARLTIIVEGEERSGALHTVEFAHQLGTLVGAVPGSVLSPLAAAPNYLIRRNEAALIRHARDVLDELLGAGGQLLADPSVVSSDVAPPPLNYPLDAVLNCVASGDATPEKIAASLTDLDLRSIMRALGQLELLGRISSDFAGVYHPFGPSGDTTDQGHPTR